MADMITRCPKCGTAFRISDTLLKSAKGMVRCGSCLSVFNAREHLETKPVVRANPAPAQTTTAPAPQTSSPHWEQPSETETHVGSQQSEAQQDNPYQDRSSQDEDRFTAEDSGRFNDSDFTYSSSHEEALHTDEEDFAGTQNASEETLVRRWPISEPEDERIPRSAAVSSESDDVIDEEDDESWALELLKDDSDLNIKLKKITTAPTPAQEETVPAEPDSSRVSSLADELDSLLATDEAPAHSSQPATDSAERETQAQEPEQFETAERDDEISLQQDEAETESAPVKIAKGDQEEAPAAVEEEPTVVIKRKPIRPKLEPKSPALHEVIAALEPEPLEVNWQEPGAWRKRLLWPALALLALVCLLAQVAWLEFDRLSRIEPYRAVYGIACRYIGCQLPELVDRSQIQTSNLLVRSHPTVVDALQVDVILQNNAPFEQSFPSLELTFTNLRSEPVAKRKLTPAEYLGGELAGRDKMPIRQPIHIALEIADPGKEAVSYHISIVD